MDRFTRKNSWSRQGVGAEQKLFFKIEKQIDAATAKEEEEEEKVLGFTLFAEQAGRSSMGFIFLPYWSNIYFLSCFCD